MIVIAAIIIGIIFWPIALAILIGGTTMIPLLPVIGAAIGMMYRCTSCNFTWSFRDVESYMEERNAQDAQ